MKTYTLIGSDGRPYASEAPGLLGGHRGNRVYGRLDCPGAVRWIARGHYVRQRVFFADEAAAVAAGYRPCASCLPSEYRAWKDRQGMVRSCVIDSPVGPLRLRAEGDDLVGLAFDDRGVACGGEDGVFADTARQLREYFRGTRAAFDLPLRFDRGSEFERRVWQALLEIPYGATTTYGEIARAVSGPGADPPLARDVGGAVGRNPLSIIVACHRVVGRDGRLTGYAGGLDRKRFLLELEQPPPEDRGQLW